VCNIHTQKKLIAQKPNYNLKTINVFFFLYNLDCKAYRFIEESIRKLIISQDVVFNEAMTKDSSTKFNARRSKVERDSFIGNEHSSYQNHDGTNKPTT